jgi:hypothetical protein
MFHRDQFSGGGSSRVVRLMTRRVFIDEGLIFLDNFEKIVLSLSKKTCNIELNRWLSLSMTDFRNGAAIHNLGEVSLLAEEVSRVFRSRERSPQQLSAHSLFLVQAALSQLRLMLAPSLDGAGENSLRIMTGLMREL